MGSNANMLSIRKNLDPDNFCATCCRYELKSDFQLRLALRNIERKLPTEELISKIQYFKSILDERNTLL
jgi:ABC-type uncharacterized transport system auxiliary subunit